MNIMDKFWSSKLFKFLIILNIVVFVPAIVGIFLFGMGDEGRLYTTLLQIAATLVALIITLFRLKRK